MLENEITPDNISRECATSPAVPGITHLMSHFPGAVLFATDAEGRYTYLAGPGLESLGIVPEEWLGRSIFEFLKDLPEHRKMMEKIFRGETFVGKSRFGNHDFEDRFCPVYDSKGEFVGIAGVQIDVTEKIRTESELNQNIALLDNLFNSIPDNAYVLDQNLNVLRVNKSAQNMFPDLPLLGNRCFQTIHGRETPCEFCPVIGTFQTGQATTIEYFEEKLGKYFELTSFPIRDQNTGAIIGATEFARDITVRKRMEESLLRSRDLLEELMANLDEGVYLINTDYTIVKANKAMSDMYPDLAPLVGKKCYDTTTYGRICPDCAAEAMFREGKPTTRTFFEKNNEDEPGVWLELTAFPLYEPGGDQITTAICVLRNVTPRIELESQLDEYRLRIQMMTEKQMQQLRISEARLRTILETSGAAISFADYRGRFSYVNGMYKEMFGYSEEEILGKSFTDIIEDDPVKRAEEIEKTEKALRGETDRFRSTCRFKAKDGHTVWGDVHVSIIRGTCLEEMQMISVIADITAQQQLVEHLNRAKIAAEEASRAKSQFLATMSHEIRTPLNGVIGVSDLLMETTLQPKQQEYARLIKASGQSLLFLINDILDFSKIEAGKLELEETEFIVHDLVESVLGILASSADGRNLELITTFDKLVPGPIFGDPGRLRQILVNLAGNALKFTKKGGVRIHVTVDELLDKHIRLKFSVADTGIGIAKERQNRLFESFSQVDASSARTYGGTGLGLAISKKLVELMGGEIHVESVEGKGSVFWFTAQFRVIPLVLKCLRAREHPCVTEKRDYCRGVPPERCARSGREVAYLQRVAELNGLKTLLVGTGEVKIPALVEQMHAWGMDVQSIASPQETLPRLLEEKAIQEPFPLVIVDFQANDSEAESLVRKIQDDPRLKDTAIIGLTPLSEDPQKKSWKYPQKIRYVSKPVGCSILLDAVVRSFFVLPDLPFPSDSSRSDQPEGRPVHVLVAEDNQVNRIVISEILKNAGMKSTIVENGEKAVEIVRKSPFDIVLMDCQMPLMDGYEATGKIRRWETDSSRSPRLPIIALTANATSEDEAKCLAAGMDAYCSKPIEATKLIALIYHWIDRTVSSKEESGGSAT